MTRPLFTVEEQTPRGYKYNLALRLLDNVTPNILSINNPLSRRVAIAYSWYIFLREADARICSDICGGVDEDYRKWGEKELEAIAKALSTYAARLLHDIMKNGTSHGVKPPRPPI